MSAKPINVDLARSLLRYDPSIGGSCLTWINDGNNQVKAGHRAGRLRSDGYWQVVIGKKLHYAHRVVWAIVTGKDALCQIDHINGIEADNRIENLRLALRNQFDNQQNQKKRIDNASGYVGVSWYAPIKKWKAQISANKKKIGLGYFDTPQEAHAAYVAAKAKLHLFQPSIRFAEKHHGIGGDDES